MPDLDKAALLERKRPILRKNAKDRMLATQNNNSAKAAVVNLPQLGEPGKVRDQLAKELGVSGKTYGELKTINEKGTEDLKQAVK